jgi:hypothetical protein
MENSLIRPAQLWNYGITVDVVPIQVSYGMSLHGMHHQMNFLNYVWMYFLFPYQVITSDAEWNPYSSHVAESERP